MPMSLPETERTSILVCICVCVFSMCVRLCVPGTLNNSVILYKPGMLMLQQPCWLNYYQRSGVCVSVCVCVTIWAKPPDTACQVEHGVSNAQVTWLGPRTICRRDKTGSQLEVSLNTEWLADAQLSSPQKHFNKLLQDVPRVWSMTDYRQQWVGQTQE